MLLGLVEIPRSEVPISLEKRRENIDSEQFNVVDFISWKADKDTDVGS
jgi:hypothetical protein